jgi:branched-chain amino acid transport system substrate-binding protein
VTGAIAFDDIGDALRDSAFVKECNTETGSWDFVTVATVG